MRFFVCLLLLLPNLVLAAFADTDLQAARALRWSDACLVGQDALQRVAEKGEPLAARQVLATLSASKDQHVRVFAQALTYRYAERLGLSTYEQAALRRALMDVAAAPTAFPSARNHAIEALAERGWEGDLGWWHERFEDSTLMHLQEACWGYRPLARLADRQGTIWIPRLIAMLAQNETVRSNAALVLAYSNKTLTRRDVALALLPWLDDESWISAPLNSQYSRWAYIESLKEIEVAEAVPGLLRLLACDSDEFTIQRVAGALEKPNDPRILPALQKRLAAHYASDIEASSLVSAIYKRGGFSDDELTRAFTGYARLLAEPDGEQKISIFGAISTDLSLDLDTTIAVALLRQRDPEGRLTRIAIGVRDSMGDANAAAGLDRFICARDDRPAIRYMTARLEDPKLPSEILRRAVGQRRKLAATCRPELERMLAGEGRTKGIAAVLLERPEKMREILESGDAAAIAGLLDCATLAFDAGFVHSGEGTPPEPIRLPLALVVALARGDTATAEKARAYLVADDFPDARRALDTLRPHAWVGYLPADQAGLSRPFEAALLAETASAAPPDVSIAVLSSGYYAAPGNVLLRRVGARWTLDYRVLVGDSERRDLTAAEGRGLEQRLRAADLDDRRSVRAVHSHGPNYVFLHATRAGGRRTFLGDASDLQSTPAASLVIFVYDLLKRGVRTEHLAVSRVPGVAVVCGSKDAPVLGVVAQGDDVRVLAREPRPVSTFAKDLSRGEFLQRIGIRAVLGGGKARWRCLRDGKLAEPVAAPMGWPIARASASLLDSPPWMCASPRGLIRVRSDGLWLQSTAKSIRLARGSYARPVVDGAGRTVCVGKTGGDEGWLLPNVLVLVDVATGKETPVDVAAADNLYVVAWVPARRAFLVYRQRDDPSLHLQHPKSAGPKKPEFRLLDPVTGKSEVVACEVRPFLDAGRRPLQPSNRPDLVWAALPEKAGTAVGLYDTRYLAFTPAAFVKGLHFTSDEAWVDERAGRVWVVYEGRLLRVTAPALKRRR